MWSSSESVGLGLQPQNNTWRLMDEEWWWVLEGRGGVGAVAKGGGRRNEGTGFEGRVEGSSERQEWKEVMTRENRSLKRFAMSKFLSSN